ncbi:response regulator [Pontibaca methylaminivorans]|uniref:Regulatory protein VirG n=1 Tax=Pontibaca methylaminivorans TaxID=515897 RepID=A0A1R3X478_9RHOB|nr:response regulator [Pontibaca methylaminivorans]SIT84814.1 two-component system, OmpR family, torCAD operon response regulator TorR [Pontibaca methylaminivorans]
MTMRDTPHILIIEDEPVTRATLAAYLDQSGYRISVADDAAAAEAILAADPADLLLIDVNLSGKDGLQITREQRAISEVGIILISALTEDVDRIVGLEIGADDYVCKPFNRRELLARIKNLLRRTTQLRHVNNRTLRFEGFVFDILTRQLHDPKGRLIPLTRGEYEILRALAAQPGEVLSRDALLHAMARRHESGSDRTIDVLIRRLRQKLGDDPRAARFITTSHGEGYVFTANMG